MKKIFTLLFLLYSIQSFSQDANGNIFVRGTGQLNCGEYISAVNMGNQTQMDLFNQWIWGYIVGYQMRGSFNSRYIHTTQGNINTPDKGTVELFMKKYCNDNPLGTVGSGANELIRQMGGQVVGGKK